MSEDSLTSQGLIFHSLYGASMKKKLSLALYIKVVKNIPVVLRVGRTHGSIEKSSESGMGSHFVHSHQLIVSLREFSSTFNYLVSLDRRR